MPAAQNDCFPACNSIETNVFLALQRYRQHSSIRSTTLVLEA